MLLMHGATMKIVIGFIYFSLRDKIKIILLSIIIICHVCVQNYDYFDVAFVSVSLILQCFLYIQNTAG